MGGLGGKGSWWDCLEGGKYGKEEREEERML